VTSIGILAYGSLIDDPGCEIEAVISHKLEGVQTPFRVEFARSSCKRGGAPTLVPVEQGGEHVKAVIMILQEQVSIDEAKHMLWRRETNQVCSSKSYKHSPNPGPKTVCIKELRQFHSIRIVLYTSIQPNIDGLTPRELAGRAIDSVGKTERGRDGISYLINAKSNGIRTPLMQGYEEEIKKQTRAKSLEEALEKLQPS